MGRDEYVWSGALSRTFQGFHPVGADRIFPIALLHAQIGTVLPLPVTLPVLRPRIAYAGNQQHTASFLGKIS
jgi:hypothetical protein